MLLAPMTRAQSGAGWAEAKRKVLVLRSADLESSLWYSGGGLADTALS